MLAKQAEKDRLAREAHHLKLYKQHKAQQAELNYRKHYQLAASILDQILDLTSKMAEYRELTEKLVSFSKISHSLSSNDDWLTVWYLPSLSVTGRLC